MIKPQISETHTRRAFMIFTSHDLETLILNAAYAKTSFTPGQGMKCSVKFEDETTGSPPYKTGTRACVELIQDLTKLPTAEPQKDN